MTTRSDPSAKLEFGAGGHAFRPVPERGKLRAARSSTPSSTRAMKDYVRQCYPVARVYLRPTASTTTSCSGPRPTCPVPLRRWRGRRRSRTVFTPQQTKAGTTVSCDASLGVTSADRLSRCRPCSTPIADQVCAAHGLRCRTRRAQLGIAAASQIGCAGRHDAGPIR
jgi:hypothetical protein